MNHRACPSNPLVLSAIFAALFAFLPLAAATPVAAQTAVELRDSAEAPTSEFQELEPITVRATDPGLAGAGTVSVKVSSQLRGDEEWIPLDESPFYPGTFIGVFAAEPTLDPAPPALADGTLEVTETAGPPLVRDTLEVELVGCSAPPCPIAMATMRGNRLRFVDIDGNDLASATPPLWVQVELWDFSRDPGQHFPFVVATSGGDTLATNMLPQWPASNRPGRFRAWAELASGAVVSGDYQLQVLPGDSVTASHLDPLGLSSAIDTLPIDSHQIVFVDRLGRDTEIVIAGGAIRLRVGAPTANLDGLSVDTLAITVRSRSNTGALRDTETLALTETGVATGIFEGQLPSANTIAALPGDGELQVAAGDGQEDVVEASTSNASAGAAAVPALLRFVDPSGAEVTEIWGTGSFSIELEAPSLNLNPGVQEQLTNYANISSGDSELLTLSEQGPNSGVFRGQLYVYIRNNFVPNILDGRLGDTLSVFRIVNGTALLAEAELVPKPGNQPPVVSGESLNLPQGNFAVTTDPLSNDRDPEGYLLHLASYTQPAHGVVDSYPGYPGSLRYTPQASYSGGDAFTYTVSDPQGATAVATVTVTVFPVDHLPVAVPDAFTLAEDSALSIHALANDYDVDGDAIALYSFAPTSVQGGQITSAAAPNNFTYRPKANFNGTDSFTYRIIANDMIAVGTVTLTVTPVPDAPVAVADSATTPEETPVTINVLANDRDDDGQTFTVNTYNANGNNVVLNANKTFTFTPNTNFFGTKTFTYSIRDAGGSISSSATVTVTVTNVNDPPFAQSDSFSPAEDVLATLNVKANDSDPDGDTLVVQSVGQASHGTVSLVSGAVQYLSHLDYNGPDSFTYTVADPSGATATATVTLTVRPTNDPPVGNDDFVTTPEDTPVVIDFLANDTDPDGNTLSLSTWSSPTRGTLTQLTVSGRPHFRYTPQLNYNGSDSFTYSAYDPSGAGTGLVRVYLTVTPVNDPPNPVNDAATTAEDTAVTINVLANDSDPEANPLVLVGATLGGGATGTVTINANQTLTYQPGLNYFGTTGFITYQVSDGSLTANGTVALNVTPVNDPPITVPDTVTIQEDQVASLFPLANDSDDSSGQMSLQIAFAIINGSSASVNTVTGQATFTPHPNFHGTGGFSYRVQDSTGLTSIGTVTVIVLPVNDAPQAVADAATLAEDGSATIAVLANDNDVDGDTLAITAVGTPQHGSVTFDASSLTYTPAPDYSGPDSVSYTISDGNGGTATATVSVTVTPVNDPPVTVADSVATGEDTPVTFAPLGNDSHADGDTLAIEAITSVTGGSASATATTITFTPAADFSGTAYVHFTVGDGHGGSAAGVATIAVAEINDPPIALADTGSVAEDGSVVLSVLGNDSDPDGGTLAIIGVAAAAHGMVGFSATAVNYMPAANYHGPDAFTYTIADGQGGSATATVAIVVTPVNDAPVAGDDSAVVTSGSSVTITVLANDSDLEGSALVVSAVGTPAHGSALRNSNDTITYTPAAGYGGADSFTYAVSDGGATAFATVSVTVNDALGQVAVMGFRSVQLETGADVLSGDVVVNAAEPPPYLGATELVLGSGTTVAAGWDVRADGVTVSSGATIAADITSNGLANSGTVLGATSSPLALPVFSTVPTLQTGTPGASDVNVGTNGTITLAPGAYRDLIVAKKGVVTFSGGVYTFRSVTIQREASLLFSAPSTVKVEQKMSTATMTHIKPAPVSTATAATIVWHIAGINGTNGALASTPKPLEIATDNVLQANFYVPNGTLWLQARTTGSGSFIGRHVRVGPDVQITLSSAW